MFLIATSFPSSEIPHHRDKQSGNEGNHYSSRFRLGGTERCPSGEVKLVAQRRPSAESKGVHREEKERSPERGRDEKRYNYMQHVWERECEYHFLLKMKTMSVSKRRNRGSVWEKAKPLRERIQKP